MLPSVTALWMEPNLSLHSEARRDCSTEHRNVHPPVLSLSLSGVAEFGTMTKCLDSKMMHPLASARTDIDVVTVVTHADRSVQSGHV